jgi:hypothetical protein
MYLLVLEPQELLPCPSAACQGLVLFFDTLQGLLQQFLCLLSPASFEYTKHQKQGSGKTHIEQQGNQRDATKLDLSARTLVYLYRSRVQLKELPLMFF